MVTIRPLTHDDWDAWWALRLRALILPDGSEVDEDLMVLMLDR